MVGKLFANDPLAVKLLTLSLAVELKKVTKLFVAVPELHPAAVPFVNVPPAAAFKDLAVFILDAISPVLIFAKALLTCAAVAPLVPAVNVKPEIARVSPAAIDRNATLADDVPLLVKLVTF